MLKVHRFTADWCGPCKMMAPAIEKLISEYNIPGSKIEINSVNVDENREFAAQHSVRSIPTLVFEKDGVEVDRTIGNQRYEDIVARINKHESLN
jgi:thioredoxin 1